MEKEKDKWIKDVLGSTKGIRRAKPDAALFGKIERHLAAPEARLVALPQWRMAIAAAVLVLLLNVFALQQYAKNGGPNETELVMDELSGQRLISDFKLYE